MSRLPDKIPIEPLGEARWDRIERALWDAPRKAPEPARRPYAWIAGAALVCVVAVVWWLLPRGEAPSPSVTTGSESMRVAIDGADITVHPDSVVSFRRGAGGEQLVLLDSGGVDCRVSKRKTPFRVLAGEVTVSVVGTRFTVERHGQVSVRVDEGRVSVAKGGEERFLDPGERWVETPPDAAVAFVPFIPPDAAVVVPDPREVAAAEARARAKLLREADELRQKAPAEAAERYRKLARGSDRLASRALYDLAYVELFRLRRPAEAVAAAQLYARRFPRGAEAADILWVRFEAYLDLNQRDAARAAATEYVQRYPKGDKLERALVIANR